MRLLRFKVRHKGQPKGQVTLGMHAWDLVERRAWYLCLDFKQRGHYTCSLVFLQLSYYVETHTPCIWLCCLTPHPLLKKILKVYNLKNKTLTYLRNAVFST